MVILSMSGHQYASTHCMRVLPVRRCPTSYTIGPMVATDCRTARGGGVVRGKRTAPSALYALNIMCRVLRTLLLPLGAEHHILEAIVLVQRQNLHSLHLSPTVLRPRRRCQLMQSPCLSHHRCSMMSRVRTRAVMDHQAMLPSLRQPYAFTWPRCTSTTSTTSCTHCFKSRRSWRTW